MVFSHSQVYGGAVRALPECVVGVQVVLEAIWALPGDHPCRWCSVRVLCRVFGMWVWRAGLWGGAGRRCRSGSGRRPRCGRWS